MSEHKGRPLGDTEQAWCSVLSSGSSIQVLATLTTKLPTFTILENALQNLQKSHPILRSKLNFSNDKPTSLSISPTPLIKLKKFNLLSTLKFLEPNIKNQSKISHFDLIIEHELNQNSWFNNVTNCYDVLFATLYELPNEKWVIVLRLHIVACDRTTMVSILKKLVVLLCGEDYDQSVEMKNEINLAIEDFIPNGIAKKSLWQRSVDFFNYSVIGFRLSQLKFMDVKLPRSSQIVRFQLNYDETQNILLKCESREIKLCGALVAAGLIAAQNAENPTNKERTYAIVTVVDCRSLLEPALSDHEYGLYSSCIANFPVAKGGENLWRLAEKFYTELANYKKHNKHFTDLSSINFLIKKAIENPNLTSSSSSRTSILTVFEDSTIINNNSDDHHQKQNETIGLEDFVGCSSVHGTGPSIAIFDTIRNGMLDCVCVYPSPLHSRDQMKYFVEKMKRVLLDNLD